MRKRNIVLGLLATSVLWNAAPVHAADMAVKAPPVYAAPAATSWTGFYFGVNGGAAWGNDSAAIDSVSGLGLGGGGASFSLPVESQGMSGWLGGVQVGYNWQYGPLLFGVEGDFDGANVYGNTACLIAFNCGVKQDWIGDVTGRFGVLPNAQTLMYVKGGIAFSHFDYSFGNTFGGTTIAASTSDTRTGGLIGMGVEYMFMPNWSAKIEYNFIDWGSSGESFPLTVSGCVGCTLPTFGAAIRDTESVMKFGVNYKLASF
jgi:outer membrane immunogenic protein